MSAIAPGGGGGGGQWWIVWYYQGLNSRFPDTTTEAEQFAIEPGATAADASSALQARLHDASVVIHNVEGPFTTKSAAQSQGSGEKTTIGKATQAGTLPDIFHGLDLGSWFLRAAEILAGLVLLGIGLNSMLKGKPLQLVTSAAGKAGKAAML